MLKLWHVIDPKGNIVRVVRSEKAARKAAEKAGPGFTAELRTIGITSTNHETKELPR